MTLYNQLRLVRVIARGHGVTRDLYAYCETCSRFGSAFAVERKRDYCTYGFFYSTCAVTLERDYVTHIFLRPLRRRHIGSAHTASDRATLCHRDCVIRNALFRDFVIWNVLFAEENLCAIPLGTTP